VPTLPVDGPDVIGVLELRAEDGTREEEDEGVAGPLEPVCSGASCI
jgi:hypothetical protein